MSDTLYSNENRLKAYAIIIKDHKGSERSFKRLAQSWESSKQPFPLERFDAITPEDNLDDLMSSHKLKWNYPWHESELDWKSGLVKNPYPTVNPPARIACALSHYTLWLQCLIQDEPILVLEHDSVFIKTLDYQYILDSKYDIIGLNDPRSATRKARDYFIEVKRNPDAIQRPPVIDDMSVPQGIAGNSAYIMKPSGARKMLDLVAEYGLWPNDAIMCRQLVPTLGLTKEYYTKVMGFRSTTST